MCMYVFLSVFVKYNQKSIFPMSSGLESTESLQNLRNRDIVNKNVLLPLLNLNTS